jgi:hypothetical protein
MTYSVSEDKVDSLIIATFGYSEQSVLESDKCTIIFRSSSTNSGVRIVFLSTETVERN